MKPICSMFPNVHHFTGPSNALYMLSWHQTTFPNLTSATMCVGERSIWQQSIVSFLGAHSGQVQVLHLICNNRFAPYSPSAHVLKMLEDIPCLTLGSALLRGMPLSTLLAPHRRQLSLFLTEGELRRWSAEISDAGRNSSLRELSVVTSGGESQYTEFDIESNWEDLEMVLSGLCVTLNTLTIVDEVGMFGRVWNKRLCAVLRQTSITQLRFLSPNTDPLNADFIHSQVPNLCMLETSRPQNGTTSGTFVFESSLRLRETWGYMCIALAWSRANARNYFRESYAPLVPIIAKMAGWTDAYGSLSFYRTNHDKFVQKLFSLTALSEKTHAKRAAAAAAAAQQKLKQQKRDAPGCVIS